MSKSHVSMEQKVCLVCGKPFDTGSLLLDTRIDPRTRQLRQSLERNTVTGWGLCPEHQARHDEGYIALVGVDPAKSDVRGSQNRLTPENAYRTGAVAHIRRTVFPAVFGQDAPDVPMVFVDDVIIKQLSTESSRASV